VAKKTKQTKEQFYDKNISPMMEEIIKLCKEKKINMFMAFALDKINDEEGPLYCTTTIIQDTECSSNQHLNKLDAVHFGKLATIPALTAFTITTIQK